MSNFATVRRFTFVSLLFIVIQFGSIVNAADIRPTIPPPQKYVMVGLDFPDKMFLTLLDSRGARAAAPKMFDSCSGKNDLCYGVAPAIFPQGNNDFGVSMQLGLQNDTKAFSAQQFNFHFSNTFTLQSVIQGPQLRGVDISPNCWSSVLEGTKAFLNYLKTKPGMDVQMVINRYNASNATTGATKVCLPKTDAQDFVACFGTDVSHSTILKKPTGYEVQYRSADKVLRTMPLPTFVQNGIILSGDMSYRNETMPSSRELLVVRVAVPGGSVFRSQVFTLPVDVSQPQWRPAGPPHAMTKLVQDLSVFFRSFHSVSVDPLGNFIVYTSPAPGHGAIKSQQVDPDTGVKIGSARTILKSSNFHGPGSPYGLSVQQMF